MKTFYDKKNQNSPNFNINDLVWLSARFVKTTRPSKKLDTKRLGPFKITAKIGSSAFRLYLPHQMKIHNVFHVSFLDPYSSNSIDGRV